MKRFVLTLVMLTTCALALSCASATTESQPTPSSSAYAGIDLVAWPTTRDAVVSLFERLPESLDGLAKTKAFMDDYPPAVEFGEKDGHQPGAYVTPPDLYPDNSVEENFVGAMWWSGCDTDRSDFQSSANVAAMIRQQPDASPGAQMPVLPPGGSDTTWLACTSTYDVENGRELGEGEQNRILMWTASDWLYMVSAHTDEQRAELAGFMAEAAQGSNS